DRVYAELREARIVEHPRLRSDLLAHPHRQPPKHRLPPPRRLIHELLQTLLIPVGEPRSHRLDALTPPIQHQPTQIHLTPPPLISPRQRRQHLLGEIDQPTPHPRKLTRPQPPHRGHCHLP